MKHSRRTILVVVLVLLVAGISSPFVFRAAALRWAKFYARYKLRDLTPEQIRNLNTVPTLVTLPEVPIELDRVTTLDLGNYRVRIPKPEAQSPVQHSLRLAYPRYGVFILPVFSGAQSDDLAKQMHFKDYFDSQSAIYRSRWDQLDSQPDLPSLHRFLLVISEKMMYTRPCTEQFDGGQIRGFIRAPDEQGTIWAGVYMRRTQTRCGIYFNDRNRMTIADVHQFLSVFDMEPKTLGPSTGATTRP